MLALLVHVNGRRICLAGVGKNGVLNAGITWTSGAKLRGGGRLRRRLKLDIGGLDTIRKEFLRWHAPKVRVGDEITIHIVNADAVDAASERNQPEAKPVPKTSRRHQRSRTGKTKAKRAPR
jgi:hypothetical protein